MQCLICADSGHVDMGRSGRHADEAFISPTTNEPFNGVCKYMLKCIRLYSPTLKMLRTYTISIKLKVMLEKHYNTIM